MSLDRKAGLRTSVAVIALCAAAAVSGCKNQEANEAAPPAPSATAAPAGSAANASASAAAAPGTPAAAANVASTYAKLTDEDLAVPEDFQDETKKSIDQKNYKNELEKIEKELASPEE